MEGDGASVLGVDGVELGRFGLSAPNAESRIASFRMTDGSYNDVEFSRPTPTGFKVAVQPTDIYYAILLDQALAPTLGRFQLTLFAPEPKALPALEPSDIATCLAANTNVGCYNSSSYPCQTTSSYEWGPAPNLSGMYWAGDYGEAYDMCAADCTPVDVATLREYSDNMYECECVLHRTHTTYPASCPRVSCGTVGQRDQVNRQRDCVDPGSCANSSPYVGCANW